MAWGKFATWLNEKLKERGIRTAREASLGAGLDHAAVSRYMRGTRPSVEACQKLAAYLGLPEKVVLEAAGYFPPENPDEFIREVTYLAGHVPKKSRKLFLRLLKQAVAEETETNSASEDEPEG